MRFIEKSIRHKWIVLGAVVGIVLFGVAYALDALWSTQGSVTIQSSSAYIKVYYDASFSNEVTSLDVGSLVPGQQVSFELYIRNTHPTATFYGMTWNSTLSSVTSEITDSWSVSPGFGAWPLTLGPNWWVPTLYKINVTAGCPLGTYSWALNINPVG